MQIDLSLKPTQKLPKMKTPTFQCKIATVQPAEVRTVRKNSQLAQKIADFVDLRASTMLIFHPMDA